MYAMPIARTTRAGCLLLLGVSACGSDGSESSQSYPDASDAQATESGIPDVGQPDSSQVDGGDASDNDVGSPDALADAAQDVACPPTCDDGNACNGVETCNESTGHCEPGEPIECDDGDACNGLETCDPATGACVDESFPACPTAPPECSQSGGTGSPTVGSVVAGDPGGMRLYDANQWAASEALIDGIAAHSSVTEVSLDDVLSHLNRSASKVSNVSGTECFHTGFVWNSGDNDVTYWYPQGITGSADAYSSGQYNGHSISVVSWYHKPENDSSTSESKGVRLSIVDVSDMNDINYRLVLLVRPVDDGGTPNFEPVTIHAGGIVWYGNYLYVADTSQGFRVFDMTRILQVQTGNTGWIGLVSDTEGYHAHNYRYVIPQVSRYRLCSSSCCARFSFVGLDRSTSPHSLVAGEYSADSAAGRLHRWLLDEATGRLLATDGRIQASEVVFPGVENMQGGLSYDGRFFVSCSGDYLGLHIGEVGQATVERGWPYGPEDLHYAPGSDNLWSATEHPGSRAVFAVKMSEMVAGCN